jgi:hypothetical protein
MKSAGAYSAGCLHARGIDRVALLTALDELQAFAERSIDALRSRIDLESRPRIFFKSSVDSRWIASSSC